MKTFNLALNRPPVLVQVTSLQTKWKDLDFSFLTRQAWSIFNIQNTPMVFVFFFLRLIVWANKTVIKISQIFILNLKFV